MILGRCRSLAPTLSPAVFSHLPPLLDFRGICYGPAEKFSLACGPAFFFSALLCPLPLPLPLWGRGRISPFLGSLDFSRQLPLATAAHNRLTRLQQGLFGALLVLLPYSAPKIAHRATRGRVLFHCFFWGYFCSGRTDKSRISFSMCFTTFRIVRMVNYKVSSLTLTLFLAPIFIFILDGSTARSVLC